MKVLQINKNLYQGKKPSLPTLIKLKKKGVKNVIDVRSSRLADKGPEYLERLYCFLLGIDYKKISSDLRKGFPKVDYFEKIASEVKNDKKVFFVHCTCGVHRASFVSQATEMINNNKPLENALEDITKMGYFDFKPSWSFKIRKSLGIIKSEKFSSSLNKNIDSFKEVFSSKN